MTRYFGLNQNARIALIAGLACVLAACSTAPALKVDQSASLPDTGTASADGPLVVCVTRLKYVVIVEPILVQCQVKYCRIWQK